jgi:hypothetical protein
MFVRQRLYSFDFDYDLIKADEIKNVSLSEEMIFIVQGEYRLAVGR